MNRKRLSIRANGFLAAQGRGGVLSYAAVRVRVRKGVIGWALVIANGLGAAQGRGGVLLYDEVCERLMVLDDVLQHTNNCIILFFAIPLERTSFE